MPARVSPGMGMPDVRSGAPTRGIELAELPARGEVAGLLSRLWCRDTTLKVRMCRLLRSGRWLAVRHSA